MAAPPQPLGDGDLHSENHHPHPHSQPDEGRADSMSSSDSRSVSGGAHQQNQPPAGRKQTVWNRLKDLRGGRLARHGPSESHVDTNSESPRARTAALPTPTDSRSDSDVSEAESSAPPATIASGPTATGPLQSNHVMQTISCRHANESADLRENIEHPQVGPASDRYHSPVRSALEPLQPGSAPESQHGCTDFVFDGGTSGPGNGSPDDLPPPYSPPGAEFEPAGSNSPPPYSRPGTPGRSHAPAEGDFYLALAREEAHAGPAHLPDNSYDSDAELARAIAASQAESNNESQGVDELLAEQQRLLDELSINAPQASTSAPPPRRPRCRRRKPAAAYVLEASTLHSNGTEALLPKPVDVRSRRRQERSDRAMAMAMTAKCVACRERLEASAMVRTACKHYYCAGCVRAPFIAALNERRPFTCCRKVRVDVEAAGAGLPADLKEEYKTMLSELDAHNARSACCRAPHRSPDTNDQCPKCTARTCRHCRRHARKSGHRTKKEARRRGWNESSY